MYDFSDWINRSRSFMRELPNKGMAGTVNVHQFNIEAPASEAECQSLETALEQTLPAVLRAFLVTGSRNCDCRYTFTPLGEVRHELRAIFPLQTYVYGGPRLCNIHSIVSDALQFSEWVNIFHEDEPSLRWANVLPFISIANGDYLGLDTSNQIDDPPVLYLAHDDDSVIVSPSFTQFLWTWERVCYVGPEIWLLDELRDEHGDIAAQSERARRLRHLFGYY